MNGKESCIDERGKSSYLYKSEIGIASLRWDVSMRTGCVRSSLRMMSSRPRNSTFKCECWGGTAPPGDQHACRRMIAAPGSRMYRTCVPSEACVSGGVLASSLEQTVAVLCLRYWSLHLCGSNGIPSHNVIWASEELSTLRTTYRTVQTVPYYIWTSM